MLDARFAAMPKWTRTPALQYRRAHFKTAYNRTLDKLEYEIRKLEGRDVRIEAGYALYQLRNDGWPRGGVTPMHPGVVLYFENNDGALCFPCGTYARMEDNMHAIALTLEALRAVDRYGATLAHEQYRGFLALPAPAAATNWTVDDAAAWLAARTPWVKTTGELLVDRDIYRRAYRESAAALHPDRGGDRNLFDALQTAAKLLDQHHGLKGTAA